MNFTIGFGEKVSIFGGIGHFAGNFWGSLSKLTIFFYCGKINEKHTFI